MSRFEKFCVVAVLVFFGAFMTWQHLKQQKFNEDCRLQGGEPFNPRGASICFAKGVTIDLGRYR